MGTQRTSNKDLAEKLDTLIGILTAQAQAAVATPAPAPVQVATQVSPEPEQQSINISKGYLDHMALKVAELHANDGQARVLYARRNGHGETKLAYALKTRWDAGLKDKGLIGAVRVFA